MLATLLPTLLADRGDRNVFRVAWDKLSALPGGSRAFSRLVGVAAPYTSTIHAHVVHVEPGRAEVTMEDRRSIRNHIACIHAVALANLVELAGNTAVAYSLPDDARFIVAKMTLEYLKKARGSVRAVALCDVPPSSERREIVVRVNIENASGTLVTRGELVTLIGPKKQA